VSSVLILGADHSNIMNALVTNYISMEIAQRTGKFDRYEVHKRAHRHSTIPTHCLPHRHTMATQTHNAHTLPTTQTHSVHTDTQCPHRHTVPTHCLPHRHTVSTQTHSVHTDTQCPCIPVHVPYQYHTNMKPQDNSELKIELSHEKKGYRKD